MKKIISLLIIAFSLAGCKHQSYLHFVSANGLNSIQINIDKKKAMKIGFPVNALTFEQVYRNQYDSIIITEKAFLDDIFLELDNAVIDKCNNERMAINVHCILNYKTFNIQGHIEISEVHHSIYYDCQKIKGGNEIYKMITQKIKMFTHD